MSDKWYLKWIGINKIISSKFGKAVSKMFGNDAKESKFGRALNFLAVGLNSSQEDIFDILQKNYADMGDIRFVILPMDMEFLDGGHVAKPYRQQLYELTQLRVRYPYKMLPFLGIHPDRFKSADETLDFVKQYIGVNKPFIGLKLYPATGYYPDDARLMKMYEFAQENNIPITSHCTHGPTHYFGKIPKLNKANYPNTKFFHPHYFNNNDPAQPNDFFLNTTSPDDFQDNWTNPYIFRDMVLSNFPALKINFAHFGGAGRMQKYYDNVRNSPGNFKEGNWYYIIRQMLQDKEKYPNVYTDISYTLTIKNITNYMINDISDPGINDKILFGTDFYVVSVEEYEKHIKQGFLQELNNQTLLEKIASDNVRQFLTSKFFAPK
jgi:predicted TIM-barrel fold metal-dependent hydrolase